MPMTVRDPSGVSTTVETNRPRRRDIQIDPGMADGQPAGDHNLSLSFIQVSDSRRASVRVVKRFAEVIQSRLRKDSYVRFL